MTPWLLSLWLHAPPASLSLEETSTWITSKVRGHGSLYKEGYCTFEESKTLTFAGCVATLTEVRKRDCPADPSDEDIKEVRRVNIGKLTPEARVGSREVSTFFAWMTSDGHEHVSASLTLNGKSEDFTSVHFGVVLFSLPEGLDKRFSNAMKHAIKLCGASDEPF